MKRRSVFGGQPERQTDSLLMDKVITRDEFIWYDGWCRWCTKPNLKSTKVKFVFMMAYQFRKITLARASMVWSKIARGRCLSKRRDTRVTSPRVYEAKIASYANSPCFYRIFKAMLDAWLNRIRKMLLSSEMQKACKNKRLLKPPTQTWKMVKSIDTWADKKPDFWVVRGGACAPNVVGL